MFIRPCYRRKNGKRHAYWSLVESYRTAKGPRQRVVAYIGQIEEKKRNRIKATAEQKRPSSQLTMFQEEAQAEWVEIDASRLRVENNRTFGCAWLGYELMKRIGLDDFFAKHIDQGREDVPWSLMATILVLSRLSNPSSELHIAEHLYGSTAMEDLLGVPAEKVNEQRLYRALDKLLPHKDALEVFLKKRLGEMFSLEYDLLLYDVTSTYFEGQMALNEKAKRGHSRDNRGDCKQLCIGLVVSRCGMPLGYEVFPGNRHDSKTVQDIVGKMEERYGKANRIWVMDRGMMSQENMTFLKDGRRYIIGTPKASLRKHEAALLQEDWQTIQEGLEVKLVPSPDGEETYILCRSRDRREKEKAMHARFEARMEQGLEKMKSGCEKQNRKPEKVLEQIGRLKQRNSRAAGLFDIKVETVDDRAVVSWTKRDEWKDWAQLSEGCYMLRSNVRDWSAEDLWQAYIHLTEAEEAFKISKHDMTIRPIYHQKTDRGDAHIFVCFLTYVIWKALAQLCKQVGLGDEPRRIFQELKKIETVDVVLPTRDDIEIRKRCVTRPTEHQAILLERLKLRLPSHIKLMDV
jgi:transposase